MSKNRFEDHPASQLIAQFQTEHIRALAESIKKIESASSGATNPRIFANPFSAMEAAEIVRSWLRQPGTQILRPSETHVEDVLKTIEKLGIGGNLVTDAQIATLANEYRATVCAADTDFLRFERLRWFNPVTGQSNIGPSRN